MTPIVRESLQEDTSRRPLETDYTTMVLKHFSKTGTLKNELLLGPLHHELNTAMLPLKDTGASNILLTKVSFDCKITTKTGEVFRKYIHFDLKIPGINNPENGGALSYDFLENFYGNKATIYDLLGAFYNLGRQQVNCTDTTHGHKPNYDGKNASQDQYIRHTEQALVAYLASETGAQMLINRLRATIRGDHQTAQAVKVYNIGLHLHSTKTCCAPCEYALTGLMTPNTCFNDQEERTYSLLSNFQKLGTMQNEQLTFSFPRKSAFRLLVTVTANTNDKDHQKQPEYTPTSIAATSRSEYPIPVKNPLISRKIFTTMVSNEFDRRQMGISAHLQDKTVAISGSLATPGSPKTIRAARFTEEEQDEQVCALTRDFANLCSSQFFK